MGMRIVSPFWLLASFFPCSFYFDDFCAVPTGSVERSRTDVATFWLFSVRYWIVTGAPAFRLPLFCVDELTLKVIGCSLPLTFSLITT